MTNKDIFRELTNINPAYILAAAPGAGSVTRLKGRLNGRQKGRRLLKWSGLVACICLVAVLAIQIKTALTPAQMTDVFREGVGTEITDLEQLPAEYDGALLVKNLELEDAIFLPSSLRAVHSLPRHLTAPVERRLSISSTTMQSLPITISEFVG